MKKFIVKIEELLAKKVEVEAETPEDAAEMVKQKYTDGEYVLNADDFTGMTMFAVTQKEIE